MHRRQFTKLLALMACPLPASVLAQSDGENWTEMFAEAVREYPWLAAWGNVEQDRYEADAVVSGKWPEELQGVLYRTGPAQHEIFGYRNRHWFDGNGMVHAWRIGGGGVRHQARLIETLKLQAERAAGRALYPGLSGAPPGQAGLTGPNDVNSGNTSVLFHHDRLLALWEAGSPYEIDAETLETRGIYDFEESGGGSSMQNVPFSAHPRVDVDGSVWNFGYASAAGLLVLWHIGADGKLIKAGRVNLDPMTMPHDFVVTEKHMVMLLPPFHYRPTADSAGFLNMHEWHPEDPCRVLVVDKNDFSNHYFLELPSQWIFHYGNAWEDEAGVIRFDAARAEDPGIMTSAFTEIMRGNSDFSRTSQHHSYRLDTRNRTISEEPVLGSGVGTEFPTVDPRLSCRQYRKLVCLSLNEQELPSYGTLNEVSVVDIESGRREFYRYPDSRIPEEHLYVPRPGGAPESRDWILGSAYDWQRGTQILNLFNAERVADGPIASAELPYAIPLGLHGKFVAG